MPASVHLVAIVARYLHTYLAAISASVPWFGILIHRTTIIGGADRRSALTDSHRSAASKLFRGTRDRRKPTGDTPQRLQSLQNPIHVKTSRGILMAFRVLFRFCSASQVARCLS